MAEDAVKHGQLSYLQLPARDVETSARFYTEVFGWSFNPGYPSAFDSAGLHGALHLDVTPAEAGGPILWLFAEDIRLAISRIEEHGGRVVDNVTEDDGRLQAIFADPAGNVLGVWQALDD